MMSDFEVTLTGLEELNQAIASLKSAVGESAADGIVKNAAGFLEQEISTRIPQGPTGNLRRSLVVRKMSRPGIYVVAMDRKIAPHAHLVEYGTVNMSAQPFFRPAIDSGMSKAAGMIESETARAVESGAKATIFSGLYDRITFVR